MGNWIDCNDVYLGGENMTVQELIDELMKIEDKSMIVEVIQMMIGEYFTQESERVEIDTKEHTVYIW